LGIAVFELVVLKILATPKLPRAELFHASQVGIVHCVLRCVRRAYLAVGDSVSGKSYELRWEWIGRRMEMLASVFGIDVLTHAILSNHMHLFIRNRPDVVNTWSNLELAIAGPCDRYLQ